MSEMPTELLRFFVDRYDMLKRKLVHRLGSTEMAEDVLHDTYVKLSTRALGAPVKSPQSFLLRTAVNLAIDRIRADRQLLSMEEVDALLLPDKGANPADAAAARIELEAVAHAMDRLPPLRRQLLFASRVEGTPQKELAQRYGISLRRVEREIHLAHAFCAEQMQIHRT
ncbi:MULTISPECIES: RNA polymerase sigma factor [unclassified Variovorax]|uniref:RNA polymerase sigma factor n=1 Tax=unclassified Variovorax TaxID=663243 RepID=UPI002577FDF2|nr:MULTISPECIES: RNA polymerase sigma factor [unclassified Variovorax]MDM0089971.1 RNA polymerase sigma factor [Variovorax sp. J22G40]MDM0148363.1 RNA polymerase sigma factor [Variovorax sp. J2P1-31]